MNRIAQLIIEAELQLQPYWAQLEARCHQNTERVLQAFLHQGLSESHFASVTGYGHHDTGRAMADAVFAEVFQAESALVRLQLVSGTHAIAVALRGALALANHPCLVSVTGSPYDTLEEVIGIRGERPMALTRQGINYQELDLLAAGQLRTTLTPQEADVISQAGVVFVQRSRGYSLRPSLTIADIQNLVIVLRQVNPAVCVVVDNCYGEFVETLEPCAVGADVVAGSMIKNPGGGIVPTGGYLAGRGAVIEAAAEALTAPGIGAEGGYTFESTRTIMQGLYFAPTVVKEALKGMSLASEVFKQLGYPVLPSSPADQADIIQAIQLGDPELVLLFCRALQSVSPVDARLTPIPAQTPGYQDPVVMAGGTFIFGSTIELSADAPMRPPYTVFLQGGLTYSHVRYALKQILSQLADISPKLSEKQPAGVT